MSILYDDAQQAIGGEAIRILADHTRSETLKILLETTGRHDAVFWNICREQGWTAVAIPEEFGGIGLGLVEMGLIAEAIGRVAAGAPFLGTGYGVAQAILRYGSDRLKARWLPLLASGDTIGAVAFAEGADMLPSRPALRFADGRLTGMKPAVSAGGSADIAILLASGDHGPVLVLVELETGGVTRQLVDTFDNSRCTADLHFDEVAATILVDEDALAAARSVLELQAVVTAHEQVGGAEAMLGKARDYAMERRAFGQVIGGFQSVKHRIAEDYVLVELARANAIQAAATEGQVDFGRNAAAARLSATEAYDTVSRDATQVHGGIGVTWEADLHLHQRRARTLAIENGPSLFWEDALVDYLVGEAA
ncbi:acyl-CoA dehydrogenase family protein [Sphingobium sp.]|uniref:acyl-CoA dehydrogenase family protein n=1 Tax=Sphingobium TaxID=165695 RepID=UPI001A22F000|nr:acyl-CoA dehydrogenase family protein [Sphingobium sp.]MBJ7375301.1 acyl-CoA/acyl-ACP dehydrogenase [Sphingobium sp.]